MNTIFEIKLKNEKLIIPGIASFVSDSAVKLGLSNKKAFFLCFMIETALEYRLDNLKNKDDEITLTVSDTGSSFKFTITDFGEPYILTNNQQAILQRKLVDKYYFEQNGRKGQSFSFTYKYDCLNYSEIKQDKEEGLLDEEYNYHLLNNNEEDILKAVKCLYTTYGYDYYHQHLYSVEAFKKYIDNGHYVPIICENKNKQYLCYCALDENTWFMGLPELANLVTMPIARGKGLASEMFAKAETIAKDLNYEGVHVSSVAYHNLTQKMANKFNYTPSAIEYSINPKGTGGYDNDRRLDCVIGVKIFNKEKKHQLYLKEECNEMFEMIFNNASLNYEIINKVEINNNEDEIAYFFDSDTSNTFFKIDSASSNFKENIIFYLDREEIKNSDVITINLNMNNASSIKAYEVLRQLNFICTGCIPGCANGDYMLLQKYKVQPEYEKIVLEDNYRELLKQVYKLNNIKSI